MGKRCETNNGTYLKIILFKNTNIFSTKDRILLGNERENYRKQSLFEFTAEAPVWSIYCHQLVSCHDWITLLLQLSRTCHV